MSIFRINCYLAALIGRITGFARSRVFPWFRPSICPVRKKRIEKPKIYIDVPQGRSNRYASFLKTLKNMVGVRLAQYSV